jgi:hypothetical protein
MLTNDKINNGRNSTSLTRNIFNALPIWFSTVFTDKPISLAISWYNPSSGHLENGPALLRKFVHRRRYVL